MSNVCPGCWRVSWFLDVLEAIVRPNNAQYPKCPSARRRLALPARAFLLHSFPSSFFPSAFPSPPSRATTMPILGRPLTTGFAARSFVTATNLSNCRKAARPPRHDGVSSSAPGLRKKDGLQDPSLYPSVTALPAKATKTVSSEILLHHLSAGLV